MSNHNSYIFEMENTNRTEIIDQDGKEFLKAETITFAVAKIYPDEKKQSVAGTIIIDGKLNEGQRDRLYSNSIVDISISLMTKIYRIIGVEFLRCKQEKIEYYNKRLNKTEINFISKKIDINDLNNSLLYQHTEDDIINGMLS